MKTQRFVIAVPFLLALAIVFVGCDSPAPTPIPPTPTPMRITTPTPTPDPIILSGFPSPIASLAWSPDGQTLATGIGENQAQNALPSNDFTVRLWDRNGELKATMPGHQGAINSLAWSPDGKILASGSGDGTIRLWTADGSPVKLIECGKKGVSATAWSPDGTLLAAACEESFTEGTVQIWTPDGTPIRTLATQAGGGIFYNLAWSLDGKYLLGGFFDYTIWRVDGTVSGTLVGCSGCAPIWGVAWSPDSTRWVTGGENSQLEFFDLQAKSLGYIQANASVNVIAWSPDGKVIAGGVGLWRGDSTHIADITGLGRSINALAWSPNSRILAAASDNKLVGLFAPDGSLKRKLAGHEARVTRLAWSPDASIVASASDDKTVRLWHIKADE